MTIRAILFDWDGTLVRGRKADFVHPARAVSAYAARNLSGKFTPDDFERAFLAISTGPVLNSAVAPTVGALLAASFAWLGASVSGSDIEACSRLVFRAESLAVRPYDDTRPLLEALRARGYRLGVVSNAIFPAEFIARKANEIELGRLFDCVVTSADVGVAKPAVGIFERALANLGTGAHETLFVGDTVETDIVGARAAGMRAVLVERSLRAHDASGYLVIERLAGLTELLGDDPVA